MPQQGKVLNRGLRWLPGPIWWRRELLQVVLISSHAPRPNKQINVLLFKIKTSPGWRLSVTEPKQNKKTKIGISFVPRLPPVGPETEWDSLSQASSLLFSHFP